MSHLKGLRCKARLGSQTVEVWVPCLLAEMNAQVGSQEK